MLSGSALWEASDCCGWLSADETKRGKQRPAVMELDGELLQCRILFTVLYLFPFRDVNTSSYASIL
jgi:hypothetical protein